MQRKEQNSSYDGMEYFMGAVGLATLFLGGIGMGVAYGLCELVNLPPMPRFFDGMLAGWQPAALSFCLLGLVAVLSALYPARRAAAIDPIEALRFEAGG